MEPQLNSPAPAQTGRKEKHERMRENLRRFGCCIILYSYEELRKWTRPIDEYSKKQQKTLKKDDDPLVELYQFFYGKDGLEEVIQSFEIPLSVDNIRRVVKPLFAQARACLNGEAIQTTEGFSDAQWDLLLDAVARKMEEGPSSNEEEEAGL